MAPQSIPRTSMVLPLTIACALMVENIDATVIATSLPVIARDIGESPIALKLALTAYLISLAVFIPISSWMADRFGSRTVFRSAIGVFMLGSIFCGFSMTLTHFVVARFLQGIGGAMMVPVGRLVLMKSVEKRELVRAMSYLTVPALLGPVFGPPLGGFISTYFDWRWIFFINIPISLAGIYFGGRFVPNIFEEARVPLDAKGFVLSAFGLSTLTLGLATAGQHMLSLPASMACVVVGGLCVLAYLHHARRVAHPLLTFRYLRVPSYRAGVLGGGLFRMGIGALPFLLPLMLQLGFGFSALQSGLLTCSSAVAAMGIKTQAVRILRRFGFRRVLLWNTWFAATTFAGIALFTAHTPYYWMLGLLLCAGFFRSLQFTSLGALVFADIDRDHMGPASGLSYVIDQLAMSAGITIAAYALQISSAVQGHAEVMADDFSVGFVVVGVVIATSYFFIVRLPKNAGTSVSGAVSDVMVDTEVKT